ncbi:MAG TPA: hypothetical protein VIW80_00205 [Pyrinomonadaceae bacterium]|jgi:hypothetical protein
MTKLLSRITSPAASLYIFVAITQTIAGIYISRGIELPPAFTFLYPLSLLWVIGWWLQKDSRKHGVAWIFDMGLFLSIAWPFIMPYYLFKTRGMKAFLPILAFIGLYLGGYVMGAVIYALLA